MGQVKKIWFGAFLNSRKYHVFIVYFSKYFYYQLHTRQEVGVAVQITDNGLNHSLIKGKSFTGDN